MGKRPTTGRNGDQGEGAGVSAILQTALGLLLGPYEQAEERGVSVWKVAAPARR